MRNRQVAFVTDKFGGVAPFSGTVGSSSPTTRSPARWTEADGHSAGAEWGSAPASFPRPALS